MFLDAYIDRAPGAGGPGATAEDIDECDWIVVGHSHFDHLWGAERIMAATGARLIGGYETVRLLEQAGVPLDPDDLCGRRGADRPRRRRRRLRPPEPALVPVDRHPRRRGRGHAASVTSVSPGTSVPPGCGSWGPG